jgi:uncharacterized protein (UPF0333 family)
VNAFKLSSFKLLLVAALVFAIGTGYTLAADEHAGEHPGDETGQESTSWMDEEEPEETFSAAEIKNAIRSYISTDQKLKNGFFYIYDTKLDTDWKLSFSKLHPVRIINREGEKIYFACTNGTVKWDTGHKVLDLYFWVEP